MYKKKKDVQVKISNFRNWHEAYPVPEVNEAELFTEDDNNWWENEKNMKSADVLG